MKIQFTKEFIFKACDGHITHHFKVGDVIEATAKVGQSGSDYFVTSLGGIWTTEAKEVASFLKE